MFGVKMLYKVQIFELLLHQPACLDPDQPEMAQIIHQLTVTGVVI